MDADWLAGFENVPAFMAEQPNWLLYELLPPSATGKKPRKVPMYANGIRRSGTLGRPEDRKQLVTLDQALAVARRLGQQITPGTSGVAGLGFATFENSTISCIDLDDCIDINGSMQFNEHQRVILDEAKAAGAMIEVSPSGSGLHIWGSSGNRANGKANAVGVELFSTTGFVTVTGNLWGNSTTGDTNIVDIKIVVDLAERIIKSTRSIPLDLEPRLKDDKAFQQYVQGETIEELRSALRSIPADDRQLWVNIGQALKGLSCSSLEDPGWKLFEEWSATSEKYDPVSDFETWQSFRGDRTGYKAIFAEAQRRGWTNPRSRAVSRDREDVDFNINGLSHPLLNFTPIDGPLQLPIFIIPGFITEGVLTIAGAPGVGKTTSLIPLALTAAGIHFNDDPLAPKHWRHVVYISEDVDQAKRILLGITCHSGLGAPPELFAERFHLVPALRMSVESLILAGMPYRERFTRVVDGVEIPPLIVIDTKSAVIATEDENSNSEISKAIALLKQKFAGLPVWLIGHVAKQNSSRTDIQALSMRGGGAIEGDANQTAFLINDKDRRFLVLGKRRFEARWLELEIETHTVETVARDQWGDLEPVTLRWGRMIPSTVSRIEMKAQVKKTADEIELRARVLEYVTNSTGTITRSSIYENVRGRRQCLSSIVKSLLESGELISLDIPKIERSNNKQKTRIVLGELIRSNGEGTS